jgi:hypothetical protein
MTHSKQSHYDPDHTRIYGDLADTCADAAVDPGDHMFAAHQPHLAANALGDLRVFHIVWFSSRLPGMRTQSCGSLTRLKSFH